MKKKAFNKQVKRIEAEIERWFTCLGFKWWHKVTFEYHNTRKPFRTKRKGREVLMRYECDWARLWAYIEINVPLCAILPDADLTAGLLHEFAHLLVAPMANDETDEQLEEYVVSRLSQIFEWIRSADR